MSDKNKSFVIKSREIYLRRLNHQKQVLMKLKKKKNSDIFSEKTEIVFYGGIVPVTNTYTSRSAVMYNAYLSK